MARIAFYSPENWMLEIAGALNFMGHNIEVNKMSDSTEMVLCMSSSAMDLIPSNLHCKLVNYNWDTYHWQFDNPRPGDNWEPYKQFLARSDEIWVPSECTKRAMDEIYGFDILTRVIPAYVPLHHLRRVKPKDNGYILHAMRDYPDEMIDAPEKICKELGIPYIRTKNELPPEDYRDILAGCSFLISHYKEASTGGFAAVEAATLGKPVLLSDSPYNGGNEYLKGYAETFRYGDEEDLKKKIKEMWEKRQKRKRFEARTLSDMVNDICEFI